MAALEHWRRSSDPNPNPRTPEVYRAIVIHLRGHKTGNHTYLTEEERCLRGIIKRILESMLTDEVKFELEELGLHPSKMNRMISARVNNKSRKCENRIIKVNVLKSETCIFNLVNLAVRVNAHRVNTIKP